MMWIKALSRLLIFFPLAVILLPIPSLYATLRKLDRLPWGLNYVFGCMEDGWNGTGCDPSFPRKFWRNVDGVTVQGWYPDHLGLIWDDLSWHQQWRHSYVWCAFRNIAWNIRLRKWFATSIHFEDITIYKLERDGKRVTVEWADAKGKTKYFKTRKICNEIWIGFEGSKYFKRRKIADETWLTFGYEFYIYLFDSSHPWFDRVREEGYTFNVTPFKNRSIPSFRIKKY
jgi:hypothetical protein